MLTERYQKPPPRTRHHRLLCGVARCGLCGSSIGVTGYTSSAGTPHHYYLCLAKRSLGREACSLPILLAAATDDRVWDAVADALGRDDVIERALADADRPTHDPDAVERAGAEVRRLDALQAQAYDLAARGLVSPEVNATHMARLGRDRKAAERALREARAASAGIRAVQDRAALEEAVGLFRRWAAAAEPAERRAIVRRAVSAIAVRPDAIAVDLIIDVPTVLSGAGSWSNAARRAPPTARLTIATPRRLKRAA